MEKLNDLILLVNFKNNPFDNYSTVKDETILAIAEAFRELEQRAEAAEAKLAELEKQEPYAFCSKWTDMKTEGRHFSGSIFNNARGDYTKPLFTRPAPAADLAELVPVITRLKRRYVCNEGSEFEFIACVTPERSSIGTGQVWDDWRELSAILRNIKGAKTK